MLLGLSESLPHLVESKFKLAKAAQNLIFSPTELAIIRTTKGIPLQIRYCPSLAKKPTAQKDDEPRKKGDPFDNPSADLWIADIPAVDPTHLLVLNKFPVIVNHFILATKTNKPQTHLLEEEDLHAAYTCLQAWGQEDTPEKRHRLFAFFNSGQHSGASQPHRHLQFLPVESMANDEASTGWRLLIDIIASSPDTPLRKGKKRPVLQHPDLPIAHFVSPIAPWTSLQLYEIYKELYQAAEHAVKAYLAAHHEDGFALDSTEDGSLPISYNLAMTTTAMAILPRRKEGQNVLSYKEADTGLVALNGTALAGTLMVKHQEQWEMLKTHPEKLDELLGAIGFPNQPGIEADSNSTKL